MTSLGRLCLKQASFEIFGCKYVQSNPAIRSPDGNEKKFEIAGLRNNRGRVKGKGKSKGIRSSFEIAGTSN